MEKLEKQIKELVNGIKYISCKYLQFGDYDNSTDVERANVRYLKEHDELKDSIDKWSMNNFESGQYLSDNHRSENGFATWQPIESNSKLIEAYGGYGSIQLWVREDVWNEMELDNMEYYCVINDDMVSQIEMEMEEEAWKNYIKSDLIKFLSDDYSEEQNNNREVKCQNCNWEGIVNELIIDVGNYPICPNCNNGQMLRYYPIGKKTMRDFADIELSDETLWDIYRYCCEKANVYGIVEAGGNWYIDIDKLKDCFIHAIEQYYNGFELCANCNGLGKAYIYLVWSDCPTCKGNGFVINDNKEDESEKEN